MTGIAPLKLKQKEVVRVDEQRLSKRLCYVLRYGARMEGLKLHKGGFVDIDDILALNSMSKCSQKDILQQAKKSRSSRGTLRFETRVVNKRHQIRAVFGQSMEANPYHQDSGVPTLVDTCLSVIAKKIKMYNLDDFPDQYLHGRIVRKLKGEKLMNNGALQVVIIPEMERLNLSGVFLTERSLSIICERGQDLKVLNLRGSGYLLNDHFLERLLMKLDKLESLNISGCVHLTDRSLRAIIKYRPNLIHLSASAVWQFTGEALLNLITCCSKLEFLDIYDNRHINQAHRAALVDIGQQRKIKVVLKGLTDECVALKDPAEVLDIWLDMTC